MRSVSLLATALCFLLACGVAPRVKSEERVVSLVPSATEVIYVLGADARLVGNTNQCDYPEAARGIYKVGDFVRPDIERIIALRPTLVLVTLPIHRQVAERLAELGIRTFVSRPADIEAVLVEIESIGALVGRQGQARELVARMRARLVAVPVPEKRPRVFVELSSAPLMTAGGTSFITDLIRRAGGQNIFADVVQEYPVIDPEAVVSRNPDVVLILHPGVTVADVGARVGWQRVEAVRSGRVYVGLNPDLFFRPGPRLVDGIELLQQLLHERPGGVERSRG